MTLTRTLACLLLAASTLIAQDDSRWDVVPNVDDLDDWNVLPNSPCSSYALSPKTSSNSAMAVLASLTMHSIRERYEVASRISSGSDILLASR